MKSKNLQVSKPREPQRTLINFGPGTVPPPLSLGDVPEVATARQAVEAVLVSAAELLAERDREREALAGLEARAGRVGDPGAMAEVEACELRVRHVESRLRVTGQALAARDAEHEAALRAAGEARRPASVDAMHAAERALKEARELVVQRQKELGKAVRMDADLLDIACGRRAPTVRITWREQMVSLPGTDVDVEKVPIVDTIFTPGGVPATFALKKVAAGDAVYADPRRQALFEFVRGPRS